MKHKITNSLPDSRPPQRQKKPKTVLVLGDVSDGPKKWPVKRRGDVIFRAMGNRQIDMPLPHN